MAKLILYRGQTYNAPLPLGMDLTGATVYFTAKPAFDNDVTDAAAVIKKDILVHQDEAGGITTLDLTTDDTDIEPGDYVCDVHVKKAGALYPYKPETLVIKETVTMRS